MDEIQDAGPRLSPWAVLVRLLRTPVWRMVTVAMTLSTFCIGGLAFWMPTFLVRTQGMTTASAGSALGGMLVVTGILGALVGGMLGDWATSRWRGGHLLVSAVAVAVAAPLVSAMPFLPRTEWVLAFGFGALFLLGLTAGPINAALVGCVPAGLRSVAVAVNNVVLHLLGDALSPYLIGWISDATNLRIAVSLSAVPVALAGLILLPGALKVNRWPDGLRYYPATHGGDR